MIADELILQENLSRYVTFLADSICAGRSSLSRGGSEAAFWLCSQFESSRLVPVARQNAPATFSWSFSVGSGAGHNIVGLSPATKKDADYIIVAAHYDNLGILSGSVYPGADSNASGVAVMLSLAKAMRSLSVLGRASNYNLIFVGLDAKQLSMAGSQALYDSILSGEMIDPISGNPIEIDKVVLMVNIDIIGSSLEPVRPERSDYLIMLSSDSRFNNVLGEVNYSTRTFMDLHYDYYGSEDFTDLFLNRIGDQKPFISNGIPSVLFTSGITMNTNKVTDTVDSLNMPVLKNRATLIFRWLEKIATAGLL